MFSKQEKAVVGKVLPVMVRAHSHYNELKENKELLGDNESLIDTALGTDGILLKESNTIIIALAGSNETMDWLINIGANTNKKGIHTNFYKTAEVLWYRVIGEILPQSRKLDKESTDNYVRAAAYHHNNLQIYCAGYSNGAAIANLLALQFYNVGFKNINLVTWGEPNEYTKQTATHKLVTNSSNLKNNYICIHHGLDPVAYIPIMLTKKPSTNTVHTGGWHWFPHNFQQYIDQTVKLLEQ